MGHDVIDRTDGVDNVVCIFGFVGPGKAVARDLEDVVLGGVAYAGDRAVPVEPREIGPRDLGVWIARAGEHEDTAAIEDGEQAAKDAERRNALVAAGTPVAMPRWPPPSDHRWAGGR